MAVRKVSYVDLKVPNRAGQAAHVLGAMEEAGINLLAFTGFPDKAGRSQIDLVTKDLSGVRRVARSRAGGSAGPSAASWCRAAIASAPSTARSRSSPTSAST